MSTGKTGKWWAWALVCLMVISLGVPSVGPAYASSDYTFYVANGKAVITGYTGAGGVVAIPSELGGYPVGTIEAEAFSNKGITSVTIPNTVETIGDQAFRNNGLTSLIIPNSVTSLGSSAFSGNQLSSAIIPGSITSISNTLFYDNQLTSITIPASITTIGDYAFGTNQLASVIVPDSVTVIGSHAFAYNQLTSVTIGSGVSSIGSYAFQANPLESVNIPDNVTTLGLGAFINCQLTSVTISHNLTFISDFAFADNQLISVTIPGSVTGIGANAFRFNQLSSVSISDGVTAIGELAFSVNQLASVFIPDSVTAIGSGAFVGNQYDPLDFTIFGSSGSAAQAYADANNHVFIPLGDFSYSVADNKVTITDYAGPGGVVVIPPVLGGYPVTNIGDAAFSEKAVQSLTLPDSIVNIGNWAFRANQLVSLVIPRGVESIGRSAFASNLLTSVTIPESATSIGGGAFSDNQGSPEDLTVYGFQGSTAESYALANGFTFVPLLFRISGGNRYLTAVEVSKQGWPGGANTVLLARGDTFPDSLAGVPLACHLNAPILLTPTGYLYSHTKTEIERLGAARIILLGGTAAISAQVEADLLTISTVTIVNRLGGLNRYETAWLIAEELAETASFDTAYVASGLGFPDALAAAGYGVIPLLLTGKDKLPGATSDALSSLTSIQEVVIVGGEAVISTGVENELLSLGLYVRRIKGANRYETAVELAKAYLPNSVEEIFIATGLNFPDALAGGVLAARRNSGILLVRGDHSTLPTVVKTFIMDNKITRATILGGISAVSEGVEMDLKKLLE